MRIGQSQIWQRGRAHVTAGNDKNIFQRVKYLLQPESPKRLYFFLRLVSSTFKREFNPRLPEKLVTMANPHDQVRHSFRRRGTKTLREGSGPEKRGRGHPEL